MFLTSYDEVQTKSYFFRSASPLDLCNNPRQHGSGKPLIHGGESEVLHRVQLHVEFHRHLVHFTATRVVIKPYCILLLSKQDKYYRAIKHHCYFTKRLPLSLRANDDEPKHFFTPLMRNGSRMSHFQCCHQNTASAVRLNSQPLWKSCKQTTRSYYIHICRQI